MFEICYTLQQIELKHFLIPLDISHKVHTQDLMKKYWCDSVKAIECSDVEFESDHDQVFILRVSLQMPGDFTITTFQHDLAFLTRGVTI